MGQLVTICERCNESFDLTGYDITTQFQCTCGNQLYHPHHPSKQPPPSSTQGLPSLTGGIGSQPSLSGMVPFPSLVPMEGAPHSAMGMPFPSPSVPFPSAPNVPTGLSSQPALPSTSSSNAFLQIGQEIPSEPNVTMQQQGFTLESLQQGDSDSTPSLDPLQASLPSPSKDALASHDALHAQNASQSGLESSRDAENSSRSFENIESPSHSIEQQHPSSETHHLKNTTELELKLQQLEHKLSQHIETQQKTIELQHTEIQELKDALQSTESEWKKQHEELRQELLKTQEERTQLQEEQSKLQQDLEKLQTDIVGTADTAGTDGQHTTQTSAVSLPELDDPVTFVHNIEEWITQLHQLKEELLKGQKRATEQQEAPLIEQSSEEAQVPEQSSASLNSSLQKEQPSQKETSDNVGTDAAETETEARIEATEESGSEEPKSTSTTSESNPVLEEAQIEEDASEDTTEATEDTEQEVTSQQLDTQDASPDSQDAKTADPQQSVEEESSTRSSDSNVEGSDELNKEGERSEEVDKAQAEANEIPAEAEWSEECQEWALGSYIQQSIEGSEEKHEARDGLWSFWSADTILIRETMYEKGERQGLEKRYHPETGQLRAEYTYVEDAKTGPFWEDVPPHMMQDERIVTRHGTYQNNTLVGLIDWKDEHEESIVQRERGKALHLRSWIRIAAAPNNTDFRSLSEQMLESKQYMAYLLAYIRQTAQTQEWASFKAQLATLCAPTTHEYAQKRTLHVRRAWQRARAAEQPLRGIKMLLEGILDGAELAPSIRDIASLFNDCLDAGAMDGKLDPHIAYDCIQVASSLAEDEKEYAFVRALITMNAGHPEESQSVLRTLRTYSEDEAAFLTCYFNALFPEYSYWPESDPRTPLIQKVEPVKGLTWSRSWEELQWAIQATATRLEKLRSVQRKQLQASDESYYIPSLTELLPQGMLSLKSNELIRVGHNRTELQHTIRGEWNRLVWLCWLVGLETLALPTDEPERRDIRRFVGLHNLWFLLAASIYKEEPLGEITPIQDELLQTDWYGFPLHSLSYVHADFVCRDSAELTPTLQWLLNAEKDSPFPQEN